MRASHVSTAARLVVVVIVAAAIFDRSLEWALSHESVFGRPSRVGSVLRDYHRKTDDWKVMQWEPGCTRYDPQLSYTLAPGSCTVTDREYSVRYEINSHGLRDDEASMIDPRIVVSGDSYAMGWGVEQHEAVAEQLERMLGVTVLNAAVSSYGTAREMLLLERLGLREFETLVIQYCDNDDDENRLYVEKGRLEVMTRAEFEATAERYRETSRRYFGKHVVTLIGAAVRGAAGVEDGDTTQDAEGAAGADEAEGDAERYFLETLRRHESLLASRIVIVVPECVHRPTFVARVRALLGEERYRNLARVVSVLDAESSLDWRADFYRLDGHLTARGHARYAELIAAEIRRRKAARNAAEGAPER